MAARRIDTLLDQHSGMNSETPAPPDGHQGNTRKHSLASGQSAEISAQANTVIVRIESGDRPPSRWVHRTLVLVLLMSLLFNAVLMLQQGSAASAATEQFVSGDRNATQRIAIINVTGTISPPFTERWLRQIDQALEDDTVRGVVLAIDSPGGLVADSHQLYHRLQHLAEKKPIFVSMKRMAASGGYYIAMGIGEQGRIFAEPTTWTGSIGVIIPRYNAAELAKKVGVQVEPLMTGEFKDTLNPFREMTQPERDVWDAILKDAFDRFVGVIADNRKPLDDASVRELATGQVYTASQAKEKHLVDEIGYLDDAVLALAKQLQLSSHQAFEYRTMPGLVDVLLGAEAARSRSWSDALLDAAVPRAMYYCSWNPWVPTH